jgi:hypothetical protein
VPTGPAAESGSALALGDLNQDGRLDLALMTSQEIITILQQADGSLGRPDRLPHTAPRPGVLKLVDLDGDGGDDLALLSGGDEYPIRVRFSRPGGRLGPEERFEMGSRGRWPTATSTASPGPRCSRSNRRPAGPSRTRSETARRRASSAGDA